MLYFGTLGAVEPPEEYLFGSRTKHGLEITGSKALTFPHASRDEWDYLVARQTIEECKRIGVAPRCFGLDRTGTGRGVAAIISAEWSGDIVQIEFGDMATERPSSTADGRPSYEVYSSFVTEMWYAAKDCLEGGQIRGIPLQARKELCMRTFKWTGRKYHLEKKEDFKLRLMGNSPDDSDCFSGLVEVARRNGLTAMTRNTNAQDRSWNNAETEEEDSDEMEEVQPGGWALESFWE